MTGQAKLVISVNIISLHLPATGIIIKCECRHLGMMKKMNVLNYQVTRFARDNKDIHNKINN